MTDYDLLFPHEDFRILVSINARAAQILRLEEVAQRERADAENDEDRMFWAMLKKTCRNALNDMDSYGKQDKLLL